MQKIFCVSFISLNQTKIIMLLPQVSDLDFEDCECRRRVIWRVIIEEPLSGFDDFRLKELWHVNQNGNENDRASVEGHPSSYAVGVHKVPVKYWETYRNVPAINTTNYKCLKVIPCEVMLSYKMTEVL